MLVSYHVIEITQSLVWKVIGPSSHFSWRCYNYMLATTTKLSMLFQVLVLWLHFNEMFFLGLGLTVTEINKKVQKQENKGWHAKKYVSVFSLQLYSSVNKMQGMGLCMLTFMFILFSISSKKCRDDMPKSMLI